MTLEQFQQLLQSVQQRRRNLSQYSNRLTTWRFLCFCSIIVCAALSYDNQSAVWGIAALGALIIFIALIRKHHTVKAQLNFSISRQYILEQYIARFSNDWRKTAPPGSEFMALNGPLARDLDLFGDNSLYQYLCCAATNGGKQRLAELLSHSNLPTPATVTLRQTAVQELSNNLEFCLKFQTLGHLYNKSGHSAAAAKPFSTLTSPANVPVWQKYLLWAFTILTPLTLSLLAFNLMTPLIPICLLFGQFTAAGLCYQRNQLVFSQLHDFYQEISLYRTLISEIEQFPCQSPLLTQLREKLLATLPASQKIASLTKISECVNMRYNFVFYTLGNGLLLWDFHCRAALVNWQLTNGKALPDWLDTIAQLESLISLSVIGVCKRQTAVPTLPANDAPTLAASGLYHPLLIESATVPNDVPTNLQTAIITGSNMSGKTTFLRTIGLNAILAYAGAPICGTAMQISPMRLFTSMRITDDVSQGISSFYAEILRIKTMAEYTAEQQPMLSLIDEIFKGTNSADRVIGAIAAIEKLTLPWSILLVSTHDRELCRLSRDHPQQINNYHFCEYFTDNKISFDYQIKTGPSQTTNAKYLLKMAGIS